MYSTNIKNNRCLVKCIALLERMRIIEFTVDTGAMFTCCNSRSFEMRLKKEDLAGSEVKLLGGLVKGEPVEFHKCCLKQFTIGSIDMGIQDIWVTFDGRVTDNVLGMDILQQVIFVANPYNKRLYFCKDARDYHSNFELETV